MITRNIAPVAGVTLTSLISRMWERMLCGAWWLIVISLYNYTNYTLPVNTEDKIKLVNIDQPEPDSQTLNPAGGLFQGKKRKGGCNLIANLSKSIAFCILSAG